MRIVLLKNFQTIDECIRCNGKELEKLQIGIDKHKLIDSMEAAGEIAESPGFQGGLKQQLIFVFSSRTFYFSYSTYLFTCSSSPPEVLNKFLPISTSHPWKEGIQFFLVFWVTQVTYCYCSSSGRILTKFSIHVAPVWEGDQKKLIS